MKSEGLGTDSARRHYLGAAGKRYQEGKRAIPEAAFPWVARLRAEKLAPHVEGADTVLEYGVGLGWNLALLPCRRKLGFDVADFLATELEGRGIEFVRDTRELAEASLDAVICHHTLEHTLQPAEVLREIQRLLRVGGRLALFVPFEEERRYRRFNPAEPNHHLFSWNVQTLGNLVAEMGFHLTHASVGRFGYDRFAANWACRWRLGEAGFRCLRRAAHLIRPGLEVRVVAEKAQGACEQSAPR